MTANRGNGQDACKRSQSNT